MKNRPNSLLIRLHNIKELNGGKALDIGAGNGTDTIFLSKNNYSVTAIDIKTEDLIEKTKDLKNVDVANENIINFEYQESEYDLIVANNSLHFIQESDLRATIEKILKSLKKGGFFCFTLLGPEDSWSTEKNMTFIKYEEIIKLLEKQLVEFYFQSTEKGYDTTRKGVVKFWQIHRFIIKKTN